MTTSWLIDKSALVRLGMSADVDEWANRIERGLVGITTVTLLEVGYFARSAADRSHVMSTPPLVAMPVEYFTPPWRNEPSRCSDYSPSAATIEPRRFRTC